MCQHGTKTPMAFLPADGEADQVQSPYYQAAQSYQKTPIPEYSR